MLEEWVSDHTQPLAVVDTMFGDFPDVHLAIFKDGMFINVKSSCLASLVFDITPLS